jgi:hypothetical protein
MNQPTPCIACLNKLKLGRHDKPHDNLVLVKTTHFRGSMFGGLEEFAYRCSTCSTLIDHTNDKNEFAPWWWIASSKA